MHKEYTINRSARGTGADPLYIDVRWGPGPTSTELRNEVRVGFAGTCADTDACMK